MAMRVAMILLLPTLAAAEVPNMVREDWALRESLAAIRGWESVLESWEKAKPARDAAPVAPVPADGQWTVWPNPVPRTLLPAEDRQETVRLRLADGKVEIERARPGAEPRRETVDLGKPALLYKHPGGGGKDQWYHAYFRRFDRLTMPVVRSAPLAIEWPAPLDPVRGTNTLPVRLRNVLPSPLAVAITLEHQTASKPSPPATITATLAAGETRTFELALPLEHEGGGLAVVAVEAGGQRYWLPVLTHVEEVSAVLRAVEQIVADAPDAAAAEQLAALRRRADQWAPGRESWRGLFEEASALRDRLLLSRIRFDSLLLAKRKPYFSEQPFMDAHHLFNRPGGGVFQLSPVRPDGALTQVVPSLGEGVYRDLALHWDAGRLLFAFGNGSDHWDGRQSYHIYESDLAGQVRQLTFGPKNDCEPFYLADDRIGFTSDRSEHFVMCGGDRHAPTLHVMEPDGSGVRQLSFNVFNDFNPCLLPDGRILYSRWEYNERSVTSLHNPFTMNPDGTMVQPYYGNATIRPNVVMFPRPVPGSAKVMALFTAHHGQTHGAVGLIDVRRGIDGDRPLELLTPGVPVTGEKAEDSRVGWFSDPVPLSEDLWLCSYTPTVLPWLEKSWAIYVADRHGNLALVYRDPAISLAEPVPLVRRPRPAIRPPAGADTADTASEANLLLIDVYQGLTGVPRGTAKHLRVLEDVPRKSVPHGGVVTTSGTLIFTIKRVLGTVPIEADGSASLVVPANRNVYFEALDGNFEEIQRMRSVVCLKPGETRSCIGCHERRSMAPPSATTRENGYQPLAARRKPSRPEPPPWGTATVSYLRDIQPLVNDRCAACHSYDRANCGVILTDDLTDQFCVGYEELLPYLSAAVANRWDNPDDVLPRPPYTYGSKVSRLTRLLRQGHHGVQLDDDQWRRLLTWIDCNGVYYDRYQTEHYGDRRIFAGPVGEKAGEVVGRRCANCHGRDDGRHDTWWLSINRRDVRRSRMLAAPLAAQAGGWERCGKVFATTDDPDYRVLLAALTSLQARLEKEPREDLLSIRGTAAAAQQVAYPAPPPAPKMSEPVSADWVYLSDLPWESAAAGWTPNGDGVPRRDVSVDGRPMRVANRKYPKGIGTHAPSEIVYRLEGRYAQFKAVVHPPEQGGTVAFQVYGDEKLLFDSGTIHARNSRTVDVPIAGVRRLKLVATDGGDGYIHDCADWADARVRK